MQRASGQHDYLTRLPRPGSRKSRGRRPFAPRHRSRTTSWCSCRMERAVRGARIEPTIVATWLETAFFASQDSELPNLQTALCRSKRCRRERNFRTQRREAKNPPERPLLSAETGDLKNKRQESPQKRPVSDRRRFPQFGKTGWWWKQSCSNRSLPKNGSGWPEGQRIFLKIYP